MKNHFWTLSQSQTFEHNSRCSVRPFLPPPDSRLTTDIKRPNSVPSVPCQTEKIKFQDWITPTQSVLFCPRSSISLSKMSSVSIWTRGFCFHNLLSWALESTWAPASLCSPGRNSLQSPVLSLLSWGRSFPSQSSLCSIIGTKVALLLVTSVLLYFICIYFLQ